MALFEPEIAIFRRPPRVACFAKDKAQPDAPTVLDRAGPFEIRLASSAGELKEAQRLRYSVFYEEGRAIASRRMAQKRRDLCAFDAICDHLIVVDTRPPSGQPPSARSSSLRVPPLQLSPLEEPSFGAKPPGRAQPAPKVVGTYRLLRRDVAERHAGFYSQSEFDLAPLLARHPRTRFLELGRSCVHPEYRSKRVIELLWRGLFVYAQEHDVDVLIGCASLPGTALDALRLPLGFLLTHCQADPCWQVAAWPQTAAAFTPPGPSEIDDRRALASLPPLLKAYLRTGARCGRGAVIDHQFGTTDVFTLLPMADVEERYLIHYGQPSCVSQATVT